MGGVFVCYFWLQASLSPHERRPFYLTLHIYHQNTHLDTTPGTDHFTFCGGHILSSILFRLRPGRGFGFVLCSVWEIFSPRLFVFLPFFLLIFSFEVEQRKRGIFSGGKRKGCMRDPKQATERRTRERCCVVSPFAFLVTLYIQLDPTFLNPFFHSYI